MLSILQWNINGYLNNYIDLELLIKTVNPSVILLNETHLPSNISAHTPKAYIGHFYNLPCNTSCKQGIAILVKRNIPHNTLPVLPSNISSLSIEIPSPNKIIVTCAYIPPNQTFTSTDICNLFPPDHSSFLLAGDLNAWSPLWGSPSANPRGRLIEDAILSSNCVILNDGSPTHFSTHATFTHIYLSLCSATLSPKTDWHRIDDLHGSDHFPIQIKISSPQPSPLLKPRIFFKTDLADWTKFQNYCLLYSESFPFSSNINQETSRIQKIIRTAANQSIPQSSVKLLKPIPLWWNSELSALRLNKQQQGNNLNETAQE